MAATRVEGFAADGFAEARAAFEANLTNGDDVGAAFCATRDGEVVVDLWGGYADAAETRPWTADTVVGVYSTTKTMAAMTALLLADRGELDLFAPVARYWPQFAAAGKGAITLAQVLSHSSGLSGWREKLEPGDLYDWEKVTRLLAAQAPLWAPGTASGYHACTHGFLIGEVVRRITGKSLETVFREEIAEPLEADFWIGLPASEEHRAAELIEAPMPASDRAAAFQPTDVQALTLFNMGFAVSDNATRAWRDAEIPAVNGHGNARAIARIHSLLANGGEVDGKRLMSEAGCRRALELQVEGTDLVMGMPARFGLGFGLTGAMLPLAAPNPNTMFWGGAGGSIAIIDFDARTSFAYTPNKMGWSTIGDPRSYRIIEAMWAAMVT